MKVICIKHSNNANSYPYRSCDPQVGEECAVLGTAIGLGNDGSEHPCYRLEGFPGWFYDQQDFAPLNGPDETERLEAWQTEQAESMDRNWKKIEEALNA